MNTILKIWLQDSDPEFTIINLLLQNLPKEASFSDNAITAV